MECGDTSVISPTREGSEPVRPCDEGQMYTQKTEVSTVPLMGLLKAPAAGGRRPTVKGDFFYPKDSTHCWLGPVARWAFWAVLHGRRRVRGSRLLARYTELTWAGRAGVGSSQEFRGVGRSMTMGGLTG